MELDDALKYSFLQFDPAPRYINFQNKLVIIIFYVSDEENLMLPVAHQTTSSRSFSVLNE